MLIQNNMLCGWIEIDESPEYKFYDNVGNLYRYQSSFTKRNPWVMLCSHCPINDAPNYLNTTVYLAVMLQKVSDTA